MELRWINHKEKEKNSIQDSKVLIIPLLMTEEGAWCYKYRHTNLHFKSDLYSNFAYPKIHKEAPTLDQLAIQVPGMRDMRQSPPHNFLDLQSL